MRSGHLQAGSDLNLPLAHRVSGVFKEPMARTNGRPASDVVIPARKTACRGADLAIGQLGGSQPVAHVASQNGHPHRLIVPPEERQRQGAVLQMITAMPGGYALTSGNVINPCALDVVIPRISHINRTGALQRR